MRRTLRHALAMLAVVAPAAAFAGCSDDDGPAPNEYSMALAEFYRNDAANPFTDDQIECLSVEVVEDIGGPERLEEAGVTPDQLEQSGDLAALPIELTEEDGMEVARSIEQCGISVIEVLIATVAPDAGPEVVECVENDVDSGALLEYIGRALIDETVGDPPAELTEPMLACIAAGGTENTAPAGG